MMLLPASRQNQERFLPETEIHLTSLAQRRVFVGEFFEKATEQLLGADRLVTSTRADICPDLYKGDLFFEVKSIGASNELVIRKEYHARELQFCADHHLYYVLWSHFCAVNQCMDKTTLQRGLALYLRDIIIVPAATIHAICSVKKCFQWSRDPRDTGYRLRLKEILATLGTIQETILWELPVGDYKIGPTTLHLPPTFPIKV